MRDADQKYGSTGMWWRIGATVGLLSLCVLATVRRASGSFEPESIPVADLISQNGIVTGTMRLMGDRFLLYNGTRLESMAQSMEVDFERGGSMVMCPRSQLQILTANGNAGIMLAFQAGGAQQPFPMKMGDEVLTPDWRVELSSDSSERNAGALQIVTNQHGDLCLQGSSPVGTYFRVSQLIGDGSFRVLGGLSERFSDGKMQTSDEGCGCDAQFAVRSNPAPADSSPVPAGPRRSVALATPPPAMAEAPPAAVSPAPSTAQEPAARSTEMAAGQPQEPADSSAAPVKRKRQHPQDVAGYVRSFVHLVFGR
jgi:hypothetical protein